MQFQRSGTSWWAAQIKSDNKCRKRYLHVRVVTQRLAHHLSSPFKLFSICLHSPPFHWIHAFFCSWTHHQGSTNNHCSLSPWSLSCLWYHWSLYSYTSSILLVSFKWHCSLLAQLVYHISWFCCQYQGKSIRSTSTSSRCSTRLCSRSSSFHSLHHST